MRQAELCIAVGHKNLTSAADRAFGARSLWARPSRPSRFRGNALCMFSQAASAETLPIRFCRIPVHRSALGGRLGRVSGRKAGATAGVRLETLSRW